MLTKLQMIIWCRANLDLVTMASSGEVRLKSHSGAFVLPKGWRYNPQYKRFAMDHSFPCPVNFSINEVIRFKQGNDGITLYGTSAEWGLFTRVYNGGVPITNKEALICYIKLLYCRKSWPQKLFLSMDSIRHTNIKWGVCDKGVRFCVPGASANIDDVFPIGVNPCADVPSRGFCNAHHLTPQPEVAIMGLQEMKEWLANKYPFDTSWPNTEVSEDLNVLPKGWEFRMSCNCIYYHVALIGSEWDAPNIQMYEVINVMNGMVRDDLTASTNSPIMGESKGTQHCVSKQGLHESSSLVKKKDYNMKINVNIGTAVSVGVRRADVPEGNVFRKMNKDGSLREGVYLNTGYRTSPPSGGNDVTVRQGGKLVFDGAAKSLGRDKNGDTIIAFQSYKLGSVKYGTFSLGAVSRASVSFKPDSMVKDLGPAEISFKL